MMRSLILLLTLGMLLSACTRKTDAKASFSAPRLPYMGPHEVQRIPDGKGGFQYDTLYHRIPEFAFTNQWGNPFTKDSLQGKVYLADFFFTSCPTICPKMTHSLSLIQQQLKQEKDFHIVSHSIDPEFDTPEVLRKYAAEKKADLSQWTFLTGDIMEMYDLCEFGYMAFAQADPLEPGGIVHSGFLILVDKQFHIRGAYDGTRTELVPEIVQDINRLLHEK